jgi:hypothetical protein
METQATVRPRDRNTHAVEVLRRLNDLGAINLEVMIAKADEIKAVTRGGGASAASELEPEDKICYPFYIKLGPRLDFDIVSVASELKSLGFEVKRLATK